MKKADIMKNRDETREEEEKKIIGPIVKEGIEEIVIAEKKTKPEVKAKKGEVKKWQK